MSEMIISIIGQDGDYLLISDTEKNYKGKIHKSLIVDNELEVVNGKTCISPTMYQEWFRESISKAFKELCILFYSHIPLFMEKQNVILNNPSFSSIIAPRAFYDGMFIGSGSITLGEMLSLWEKEPFFSLKCDCDGRAVIFHFAGSPLSGSCIISSTCLQCGKILNNFRFGNFNNLWQARKKYHPFQLKPKETASIRDLIAILEGKIDKPNSEKRDDFCAVPDKMTIRIGSGSISNETFASLLYKKGV